MILLLKRGKQIEINGLYVICRFVLDTCRRLKERKSYLVWTAVGCLGVSALSDLVKEVLFFLIITTIQSSVSASFNNKEIVRWI